MIPKYLTKVSLSQLGNEMLIIAISELILIKINVKNERATMNSQVIIFLVLTSSRKKFQRKNLKLMESLKLTKSLLKLWLNLSKL